MLVVYYLHGQTGRFTVCALWYAKSRTGSPGIGFTIWTNQFHLPKNFRERLELVSKMALTNGTRICVSIFRSEKQHYLFRLSVAPGHFPLERPKKSCSTYFPTGFSETFLNGIFPNKVFVVIATHRCLSAQEYTTAILTARSVKLIKILFVYIW